MPESSPEKQTPKRFLDKNLGEILQDLQQFFWELVDIKKGMDQYGTITNIYNNKEMKGANAWLLMCSIMVASLGLDLNSPAVIIGAMLISPLMSPILGVGLGVGINDRRTLFISLKHFVLSIAIALITSYLYFLFTPFGQLTNEIASRTAPNLLDGLVAIFGGVAGIISTTRKDKSNAIPGVAIATALMPPLCVAGYGLANREFGFFLNAFYLFFLNSFFIAVSTYVVIRLLGFRYKEFPNEKERRRNRWMVILFAIVILIPAIILLVNAYQRLQEEQKIERFINENFQNENTAISNWRTYEGDSILQLAIQLIGEPIAEDSIRMCDEQLELILGKPIHITTYQSEVIPLDDIQKLKKDVGGFKGEFVEKLNRLEQAQQAREMKINELLEELDSVQTRVVIEELFEDIKINYPDVEELGFVHELQKTDFDTLGTIPLLMIDWPANKSSRSRATDEAKLYQFVKNRAKIDTLIIFGY